jgi:uncharacterized protein
MSAARKRMPEAEAYLGELYVAGDVVKRDETRALMWYLLATEHMKPEQSPALHARLSELQWGAPEEVRIEAEARARVWSDQYPGKRKK